MKESKEISRSELCQMIAELRGAVTSLQQAIKYDIHDPKALKEAIEDSESIMRATASNISKEDYWGNWPKEWD